MTHSRIMGLGTAYDPFANKGLGSAYDPFAATMNYQQLWQQKQAADSAANPGIKGVTDSGSTGSSSAPAGLSTDKWRGLIEQSAKEFGLDPDAVEAIMMLESDGNPSSKSPDGAMGLMQVMSYNFLPGEDPWDPATNIRAGVRYFAEKYKKFGNYDSAAAAYLGAADANGNPTTAQDAFGTDGPAYVKKFNANWNTVKQARQAPSGGSSTGGVFPVDGFKGTIEKHWGESTGAADIFAAKGTAVRAIRGGQVVDASWSDIGGWNVTIVDPQSGLTFYYAHLQGPPAVSTGQTIKGGTFLGGVGDTGNAAGTGAHLHLGIGPQIASGTGPNGGAGVNPDGSLFNATAYLNALLGGR